MDGTPSRTRRLILGLAVGAFAVELLIAEAWLRLARGSSIAQLLRQGDLAVAVPAGLALGLAVALATRFVFRSFAPRLVEELFVPIFGSLGFRELAAVSLLPGLGEEILFRGTLQPEIGLLATSVLFGLLHSGFSRELLPYGLWSGAVGALLGGLYLWTGSLWGSVVAHTLINAMGGVWARRQAAARRRDRP